MFMLSSTYKLNVDLITISEPWVRVQACKSIGDETDVECFLFSLDIDEASGLVRRLEALIEEATRSTVPAREVSAEELKERGRSRIEPATQ
jgi:hypothetical protein